MTDLKFTSPSGETTIKLEGTGRLGTVTPKIQLHIHGVTDKEEIDRMAKQLVDNAVKEVKMTETHDLRNQWYDEPVRYETPMTENEEEIEKVKAQIKVLEKKLSFLEELEKQPKMTLANSGEFAVVSYNYKLYYRFEYPDSGNFSWYKTQDVPKGYVTGVFEPVTDAETERLLEGLYYNHIEVKKEKEQRQKELVRESVKWCEEHPDKDPLDWLKPQTPEQVADGLKESFREAIKQGVVSKVNKPTDELIDKLTKNPPEFLKFELGPNLYDLIEDWWSDIFTVQSDMDMETSIYNLTERIEKWLPREQSAAGSQSLGVEDMVEGFNDAIKKIKRKLR